MNVFELYPHTLCLVVRRLETARVFHFTAKEAVESRYVYAAETIDIGLAEGVGGLRDL